MCFQLQAKGCGGQNQGFQKTFCLKRYVWDNIQDPSSTVLYHHQNPSELVTLPYSEAIHVLAQKLGLRAVTSLLSASQHATCTPGSSHLAAIFASFTVRALPSDEVSVMSTPILDGLILPDDGDWDRGEAASESGFKLSLQSMKSTVWLYIQHSRLPKGVWQCKRTTDN
jgi:hypothetical protein